MNIKSTVINTLAAALLLSSSALWACGGEASGKHIGSVMKMSESTFTIRDAESNSPITFNASAEIISEVKAAKGRIMVNYEENDDGALEAVGVSF